MSRKYRIYVEDIYSLGLIYNLLYNNKKYIDVLSLNEYFIAIINNLKDIKSEVEFMYGIDYEKENIYIERKYDNDICFYHLKDNFDLNEARERFIKNQPNDLIEASLKYNALEKIGIYNKRIDIFDIKR